MTSRLIEVLRCVECGGDFQHEPSFDRLVCSGCTHEVPIRNGIPRFSGIPTDEAARRTQASFGYEWTHFNDWRDSGEQNFAQYFGDLDLRELRGARVLDAGCGMGRHARMLAPYVPHIVAVDFSAAVEQAARNTAETGHVDCVQADVTKLPLADDAFDLVYSMGVLHHLRDTAGAIRAIVRKARPGGRVRIYLYWRHHGWRGMLIKGVDLARSITTRLPFPLLRALCLPLSAGLFLGLVLPYRALTRAGFTGHESLPLYVYAKYPFRIIYNDQFDRLSAPIEQRFDEREVRRMLEDAGLHDVTVRPSFGWIGEGRR